MACACRTRLIRAPILIDTFKIDPTWISPATRWRATAARPADARQPQLAQSGAPPNWHGVIRVLRSADTNVVVRAKTQSSGDSGGRVYASSKPLGACNFG